MNFRLPRALRDEDDTKALEFLKSYYRMRPGTPLGTYYSGARFDAWDSLGSRAADRGWTPITQPDYGRVVGVGRELARLYAAWVRVMLGGRAWCG